MTTARNRVLPLLLALAAVAAGAAHAAGSSTGEVLKEHVLSVRPWSDVELRNLSLDAQPPPGAPRRVVVRKGLPGPTVFSLEYGDGTVVTAKADVAGYEEIVVSTRRLWRNRPLSEEDLALSRVNVGKVPAGACHEPQDIVGKVVTRSIGPGMPVLSKHLAGSKLVKRGRKVTLVAEKGGLRVAAAGETRENAYVDDAVKVVNLASKKTVTGILVDEYTVRVEF